MYFPYLRGKQYELIALRELASLLASQGKTVPIIEPVRVPAGSGLDRCLQAFGEYGLEFVLILNPTVGHLACGTLAPDILAYLDTHDLTYKWNVGLILDERTNAGNLLEAAGGAIGPRPLTLVHKGLTADHAELAALTSSLHRRWEVVGDNLRRRHFRALLQTSEGIVLRDGFLAAERNADYLDRQETMFTEDHLYYQEDGWSGFGDYLTVGEGYATGGFTPRAVAIHWTYERPVGGPIWIRHFTSETNGGIGDVGGKFLEAADKLVRFLDEHRIHTQAAEVMRQHVINGTFPGLGVVKKLSIQNHLELISDTLSRI